LARGGALSFEAARTFVRTLKLGSQKEWHEYSKSGKRPSNIASNPRDTYCDAGWVSMPDWLGYGSAGGGGAGCSSSSSSVSSSPSLSSSSSSSSMQNVQRASEHKGGGGRKEKLTEDPAEAPPPKKMKLGSVSGAASGDVRSKRMEANAAGQVLCQTCGTSCGGKPVHWDAEQEAIVCSDCYGEGGIESDNVMAAVRPGTFVGVGSGRYKR
jgi:hypothetical protein